MPKIMEPTLAHEAAMVAMKEAMRLYADALGAEGMLALASQLVGNLIALQDQTKYSTNAVMRMVEANIEEGNRAAVHELLGQTKGSA
jgi:hypothetical protein